MKKVFISFIVSVFIFMGVLSAKVFAVTPPSGVVPSGYTKIEDSDGAALYKNGSNYYAIFVQLNKSNIDLSSAEDTGQVNQYGHKLFTRRNLSEHWNEYADSSTFAMLNGQFFNHDAYPDKAAITYPVVSYGNSITEHIDDSSKDMMTLYKTWDNRYYIKSGNPTGLLNNKEVLVGFDKDQSLGPLDLYRYIDRTYVGGISQWNCNPDNETCEMVYLVFLIGNNKMASTMVSELNRWGVKNGAIIRLDGSDSTQFKTGQNSFDASGSGARKVPHSIIIEK